MLRIVNVYDTKSYKRDVIFMSTPKNYRTNTKSGPKKPAKKEICKKTIDRIVGRRTFEPLSKPQIGCRFVRFRARGQRVEGQLGFPIENFRCGTSYPVQLDNDEIVEIIGNKLLHKQIREGELCGCRVRFVYQGRQFTNAGHHRKIFRVFKIGESYIPEKIWNKLAKKIKAKNGKRRK